MAKQIIARNKKAFYNYEILDSFEAGLVLTGTEIKSIRLQQIDITNSFVKAKNGELWLYNCHISPYKIWNIYNHDPDRDKKLLLNKKEIKELTLEIEKRSLTAVVLRVYIKNHVAKIEIGLARGKRQYEKRQHIINREKDLEAQRSLKRQ